MLHPDWQTYPGYELPSYLCAPTKPGMFPAAHSTLSQSYV